MKVIFWNHLILVSHSSWFKIFVIHDTVLYLKTYASFNYVKVSSIDDCANMVARSFFTKVHCVLITNP